jgi:iron(III) transport system permease protein
LLPGTEVLAVQILRFPDWTEGRATVHGCTGCGLADDGLWGRLSALGIIMIFISTALVLLATLVGAKLRAVEA